MTVNTFAQAEVTDHQCQVDTHGRTTGAGVVDVDAHDGKVVSATPHGPAESSSGNDRSQSRICRTRVRNVEMLGPDIALERVPAEQDSATSKGCDSEACSECRVLLKICSFLERTCAPRAHDAPDERIPGATGWTRVPTQQRQPVGTAQVLAVILEVHWG